MESQDTKDTKGTKTQGGALQMKMLNCALLCVFVPFVVFVSTMPFFRSVYEDKIVSSCPVVASSVEHCSIGTGEVATGFSRVSAFGDDYSLRIWQQITTYFNDAR